MLVVEYDGLARLDVFDAAIKGELCPGQRIGIAAIALWAQLVEGIIDHHVFECFKRRGGPARGRVLHLQSLGDRPLRPSLRDERHGCKRGCGWRRMVVEHFDEAPDVIPLRGGTEKPLVGVRVDMARENVTRAREQTSDLPADVAPFAAVLRLHAAQPLAEILGDGHGVQSLPDGGIIAAESPRQAVPEEFQKSGRVAIDVPETAQPGAIPAREVGRHPARPPCSSRR